MPRPPSNGIVTSPWGMRLNPNDGIWRMHYGEDTIGVGNYAPVTGTVVFAYYDKSGTGLGWAVGIRETANPSVIWWTGHHGTSSLSNPLKVSVGSKTVEGVTYLGPKGDTGAAVGPHAHQERRVAGAASPGSGTPTNPRSYYTTTAGGGTGAFIPIDAANPTGEELVTIYYQGPGSNLWGIFGPDAGSPGWRETNDVNTAKAWGKLYGTHPLNEDETPERNGAPWESISDAGVWAQMKAQAQVAWAARVSLAANVTVPPITIPPITIPPITVPPLVLDDATIAALSQANAKALLDGQAERLQA